MSVLLPCPDRSCLVLSIPETLSETFVGNVLNSDIIYASSFNKWYLTNILNIDPAKIFLTKFDYIYDIKSSDGNSSYQLCGISSNFAPGSTIYIWKDDARYTIFLHNFRYGLEIAENQIIKDLRATKNKSVVFQLVDSSIIADPIAPAKINVTADFVAALIRREIHKNPEHIVIGTPQLGFEKFLEKIAQTLQIKVCVDSKRSKIYSHLQLKPFYCTNVEPLSVEVKDLDSFSYDDKQQKMSYEPGCKFEKSVFIKIGSSNKDDCMCKEIVVDQSNIVYLLPYNHNISKTDLENLIELLKPRKILGLPQSSNSGPSLRVPKYIEEGNCLRPDYLIKPSVYPVSRTLSKDMLKSYKTNPGALPTDLKAIFSHSRRVNSDNDTAIKQSIESFSYPSDDNQSILDFKNGLSDKNGINTFVNDIFSEPKVCKLKRSNFQFSSKPLNNGHIVKSQIGSLFQNKLMEKNGTKCIDSLSDVGTSSQKDASPRSTQSKFNEVESCVKAFDTESSKLFPYLQNGKNTSKLHSLAKSKFLQPVIHSNVSSSLSKHYKQLLLSPEYKDLSLSTRQLEKNAIVEEISFSSNESKESSLKVPCNSNTSHHEPKFLNETVLKEKQDRSFDSKRGFSICCNRNNELFNGGVSNDSEMLSEKTKLKIKQILQNTLHKKELSTYPSQRRYIDQKAYLRRSCVEASKSLKVTPLLEEKLLHVSDNATSPIKANSDMTSFEDKSKNATSRVKKRSFPISKKEWKNMLLNVSPYSLDKNAEVIQLSNKRGNNHDKRENAPSIIRKKFSIGKKELKLLFGIESPNSLDTNAEVTGSSNRRGNRHVERRNAASSVKKGSFCMRSKDRKDLSNNVFPNLCSISSFLGENAQVFGISKKGCLENSESAAMSLLLSNEVSKCSCNCKLLDISPTEEINPANPAKKLKQSPSKEKILSTDVLESIISKRARSHETNKPSIIDSSFPDKTKPLKRKLQELTVSETSKLGTFKAEPNQSKYAKSASGKVVPNSKESFLMKTASFVHGAQSDHQQVNESVKHQKKTLTQIAKPSLPRNENLKESISKEFKSVLARKTEEKFNLDSKTFSEKPPRETKIQKQANINLVKNKKMKTYVLRRLLTSGTSKLYPVNNIQEHITRVRNKLRHEKPFMKKRVSKNLDQSVGQKATKHKENSTKSFGTKKYRIGVSRLLDEQFSSNDALTEIVPTLSDGYESNDKSSLSSENKNCETSTGKNNSQTSRELKTLAIDGNTCFYPANTSSSQKNILTSLSYTELPSFKKKCISTELTSNKSVKGKGANELVLLTNKIDSKRKEPKLVDSSSNLCAVNCAPSITPSSCRNSQASIDVTSTVLTEVNKPYHFVKKMNCKNTELKNLLIDGTENLFAVNCARSIAPHLDLNSNESFGKKSAVPTEMNKPSHKVKKMDRMSKELKNLLIDGTENLSAVNCASLITPHLGSNSVEIISRKSTKPTEVLKSSFSVKKVDRVNKELKNLIIDGTENLSAVNCASLIAPHLGSNSEEIISRKSTEPTEVLKSSFSVKKVDRVNKELKNLIIDGTDNFFPVNRAPSIKPRLCSNSKKSVLEKPVVSTKVIESLHFLKKEDGVNNELKNLLTDTPQTLSSVNRASFIMSHPSSNSKESFCRNKLQKSRIDGTENLCAVNSAPLMHLGSNSKETFGKKNARKEEAKDDSESFKNTNQKSKVVNSVIIEETPNLCAVSCDTLKTSLSGLNSKGSCNQDSSPPAVTNKTSDSVKRMNRSRHELNKLVIDGTANVCAVSCALPIVSLPDSGDSMHPVRNNFMRTNPSKSLLIHQQKKATCLIIRTKKCDDLSASTYEDQGHSKKMVANTFPRHKFSSFSSNDHEGASFKIDPVHLGKVEKENSDNFHCAPIDRCDLKPNYCELIASKSKIISENASKKCTESSDSEFWDDLKGIDVSKLGPSKKQRRKSIVKKCSVLVKPVASNAHFTPYSGTPFTTPSLNRTISPKAFLSNEIKEHLIKGMRLNLSVKCNGMGPIEKDANPSKNFAHGKLPQIFVESCKTDSVHHLRKSLRTKLFCDSRSGSHQKIPAPDSTDALKAVHLKSLDQKSSLVSHQPCLVKPKGVGDPKAKRSSPFKTHKVKEQKAKRSSPFKTCQVLANGIVENTEHIRNLEKSSKDCFSKPAYAHLKRISKSRQVQSINQPDNATKINILKDIGLKPCAVVLEDVQQKINFLRMFGLEMIHLITKRSESKNSKSTNLSFYTFPKKCNRRIKT